MDVEIMMAEVNGTEIFYNIKGEGKPLMMMHGGLGQDHTVFSPWLEPLDAIPHEIGRPSTRRLP